MSHRNFLRGVVGGAAVLGLLGIALPRCTSSGSATADASPPADRDGTATGDGAALAGLPCDVAQLLATHCMACHGASSPSSGTSLSSLAALREPSKRDPSKSEAALALERMKAGTMPPAGVPAPDAAAIAAFETWVGQGLPAGSCGGAADGGAGGDTGPDPFAGAHVCTSGSFYDGNEPGSTMEPGNACTSCHAASGDDGLPRYTIAGTVYPTGHEPARCNAAGVAGAQVVIVDKSGARRTYSVNSVGNFAGLDAIAMPFTARVELASRARAMATPQNTGDCNACHTEDGANGAPGRIVIP